MSAGTAAPHPGRLLKSPCRMSNVAPLPSYRAGTLLLEQREPLFQCPQPRPRRYSAATSVQPSVSLCTGTLEPDRGGSRAECAQGTCHPTLNPLRRFLTRSSPCLTLQMYMEMDINLYDRCSREHVEKGRAREVEREQAAAVWSQLVEQGKGLGVTP